MNPLIVAEAISAGSQLLGAKKGSDAAKEAAAQQRQAEEQGRQYLQQGLQRYDQAFGPFTSGAVAGRLEQSAWNPQTRKPGGMGGGMSLADLYRINTGSGSAPKAQYDYSNPGTGTSADLNKTQLSDLSTPGAIGNAPDVMPYVTMMNFLGEKRQVQSTAVPEMQRQGWMIAQTQTPISGVFGGGR